MASTTDEAAAVLTGGSMALVPEELSYVRSLYACCLVNIAVARVQQPNSLSRGSSRGSSSSSSKQTSKQQHQQTTFHEGSTNTEDDCTALLRGLTGLESAMAMTAVQLCDYSLHIKHDKVGLLRKFFVLEKLKM